MVRPRLGIVIPAFNEEASIAAVVSACRPLGLPIVVDDGSTDRTAEAASAAGAEIVRHAENLGYDGALNSGFALAAARGCEFVVTIDADGQHDPALVAVFLQRLDSGADLVVGIRDHRARVTERLFGWLTMLRFGLIDPLCGLKGYRMSLYNALGHVDSFGSVGTELTIHSLRRGCRLEQIPINVRPRAGLSRFGQRLRGNFIIARALLLTLVGAERSPFRGQRT